VLGVSRGETMIKRCWNVLYGISDKPLSRWSTEALATAECNKLNAGIAPCSRAPLIGRTYTVEPGYVFEVSDDKGNVMHFDMTPVIVNS